ncbi:glycosyltransferase family 2 protein [Clostridium tarantellae]|uniref:Glycosyltransferase n=1 Tax=Clostridium tarantellae TaxID=39493 RepID=A0A6I1MGT8_9CLOT|nr:glycosyltransferase family 2 protein [Clostridium tarantellae]MPQ42585.1 glycosyltransferase [Clostridium tarantellae]
MDKILLIIPCFNEEKNISKLIKRIREVNENFDILIVNDCSKDKTYEIARQMNVNILDLPCNLGIGGAVQAGYKYAYKKGYKYAIQVDGDGQHDPAYIYKLKEKLDEGYDLVIGSRFIKKEGFQSTFTRRMGIKFFYYLIKLLTRKNITDATSGFRLANKKVIKFFAENYPTDYPEPETIITLIKNGFKVEEVPVKMKEREKGESSISFLKSIYYMIKVTLAILFSYFTQIRSID